MSLLPIPYDASSDALFQPQTRPPRPLPMGDWPPDSDAIAAECARLAYFRAPDGTVDRAQVTAGLRQIGYTACGWFDDLRGGLLRFRLDAHGFGAVKDGHGIIAFRGTQPESLLSIISDALFWPVAWQMPGKVHAGFWHSLLELLPGIEQWRKDSRVDQVTVTGHSLGAAMATLYAGLHPEDELITFGSPRVGDATFAALFRGTAMRRYVDCTDTVTTVPPPLLGFVHLDGLRYIDHEGKVHNVDHAVPSLADDRKMAQEAYAPHWHDPGNVPRRELADHAPINYISAILDVRIGP